MFDCWNVYLFNCFVKKHTIAKERNCRLILNEYINELIHYYILKKKEVPLRSQYLFLYLIIII